MLDTLIRNLGLVITLLKAIAVKDYPGVINAAIAIIEATRGKLTPAQRHQVGAANPEFGRYFTPTAKADSL